MSERREKENHSPDSAAFQLQAAERDPVDPESVASGLRPTAEVVAVAELVESAAAPALFELDSSYSAAAKEDQTLRKV